MMMKTDNQTGTIEDFQKDASFLIYERGELEKWLLGMNKSAC